MTGINSELCPTGTDQLFAYVRQQLSRINRSEGGVAMIRLSVDNLDSIGKTPRHKGRVAAHEAVMELLHDQLRGHDAMAALDQGQFVLTAGYDDDGRSVLHLARRVLSLIEASEDARIARTDLACTAGVAIEDDPAALPDNVLWQADLALGCANQGHMGPVGAYDDHLAQVVIPELDLEQELTSSLDSQPLTLKLEPVTVIEDGVVAGYFATASWKPAGRDALGWSELASVASRAGVSDQVHANLLREACRAAASWETGWDPAPAIEVPICITAFVDETFVDTVADAFVTADLDPARLSVSVHENVLARGDIATKQVMALDDIGVATTLNKFGTGASALVQLQSVPISAVKIGRELVSRLESPDALDLLAVIQEASSRFGWTSMAEGVTTPAQLDVLGQHGFVLSQGHPNTTSLAPSEASAFFYERLQAASLEPISEAVSSAYQMAADEHGDEPAFLTDVVRACDPGAKQF